MAFQRIAERDFQAARGILSDWLPTGSPSERRAIVAALAHPPILNDADHVRFCLQVADRILRDLSLASDELRKTEGFRILRVGLEYAISVFVEKLPEEGFDLLERWTRQGDETVARIVRSNLGKARLTKKHPERVGEVLALL